MTNFEKFAETPEALGELLASLTVIDSPWEDAFHKAFCAKCERENCDGKRCPHKAERNNPLWWLMQEAREEQSRVVMWVKRDDYRKTIRGLRPGVKSCVSEIRQRQEEVRWKGRRRRAESLGHRGSRRAGRYAHRRCECRPACRDILQPGISRQRVRRT